ncbi:MAG: hypothetical protein NTX33_04885 [Propionibacteriales bacterium]|nr:hypothetical protein [Propionibacteriales bacterium]
MTLGAAILVLSISACGDGDDKSSDKSGDDKTAAPVSPDDGTYASAVGPNEEQVTLEVEDDTIVHVKAKVVGDCGGTTSSSESDGGAEIPIVDGAVDFTEESNGSTTTLTGAFTDDGAFEGTYTNVNPTAACPSEPFTFTATAQ